MEMSTLLSTLPMDGHSPPAKIPLHQRLPPELLTTIFDNLFILESLRPEAVRLTCRAFRDAAWPPFARLFNNRVFHLTACSLDALLELSRQPRAVPYITHLDISTVRLHGNGIENLGVWMNSWLTQKYVNRPAYMPYFHLSKTDTLEGAAGTPRMKLRMALANLRALVDVTVIDGDEL